MWAHTLRVQSGLSSKTSCKSLKNKTLGWVKAEGKVNKRKLSSQLGVHHVLWQLYEMKGGFQLKKKMFLNVGSHAYVFEMRSDFTPPGEKKRCLHTSAVPAEFSSITWSFSADGAKRFMEECRKFDVWSRRWCELRTEQTRLELLFGEKRCWTNFGDRKVKHLKKRWFHLCILQIKKWK